MVRSAGSFRRQQQVHIVQRNHLQCVSAVEGRIGLDDRQRTRPEQRQYGRRRDRHRREPRHRQDLYGDLVERREHFIQRRIILDSWKGHLRAHASSRLLHDLRDERFGVGKGREAGQILPLRRVDGRE